MAKAESVGIVIRSFRAGDKRALYRFLAEVWPDRRPEALDRRWWWKAELPTLYVAEAADGDFVGICGYIPFDLFAAGEIRRGAWIVDFFVHPSHQGKGIGKGLVAAIRQGFDFAASVSQTDAAWAAFRSAGWRPRAYVPLLLSPSSRLSRLLAWRPSASGLEIARRPAKFGREFDGFWERMAPRLPPAALRDARTLRSRFEDSPREYLLVEAERDGALQGYMVLRTLPAGSIRSFPNHRIVLVSDYLVDPELPLVFTRLVAEASAWAAAQGVRFVLCMSSDPAHQRILQRCGFLGSGVPVVGTRLRKLAVGYTSTPDSPEPQPWHLTPMDCDLDLILEPR